MRFPSVLLAVSSTALSACGGGLHTQTGQAPDAGSAAGDGAIVEPVDAGTDGSAVALDAASEATGASDSQSPWPGTCALVNDSPEAPWYENQGFPMTLQGGTLVDGVYHLVNLTAYMLSASSSAVTDTGMKLRMTVQISGSRIQVVASEPQKELIRADGTWRIVQEGSVSDGLSVDNERCGSTNGTSYSYEASGDSLMLEDSVGPEIPGIWTLKRVR